MDGGSDMDFGDFVLPDAAIIGGILGFADEAIRAEQEGESEYNDDDDTEIDVDPEQISDIDLRLFCKENPEVFRFLVKKTIEFRKKAEMQRYINRIQGEICAEINQMKEDEDSEKCKQV